MKNENYKKDKNNKESDNNLKIIDRKYITYKRKKWKKTKKRKML